MCYTVHTMYSMNTCTMYKHLVCMFIVGGYLTIKHWAVPPDNKICSITICQAFNSGHVKLPRLVARDCVSWFVFGLKAGRCCFCKFFWVLDSNSVSNY